MPKPIKNAEGKPVAKLPKAIASTQTLSAFVKSICDVMRRSNCASALQYVPELTWILFLRILDAQEARDQEAAEVVGADFSSALRSPYRWQDWAAPYSDKPDHPKTPEGRLFGWKRQDLFAAGDGRLFDFINKELLPHLHGLDIDTRTGRMVRERLCLRSTDVSVLTRQRHANVLRGDASLAVKVEEQPNSFRTFASGL